MKYYLLIATLIMTVFSCKSKKQIAHSKPITDTIYVMNAQNNQVEMHICDKNNFTNRKLDGNWKLQYIYSSHKEEMERITLNFEANSKSYNINGFDACNSYSGTLKSLTKNKIAFGPLPSTKRACFVAAKYAEGYYKLMAKTSSYDITRNNLILKNEKGRQLLQFIRIKKK